MEDSSPKYSTPSGTILDLSGGVDMVTTYLTLAGQSNVSALNATDETSESELHLAFYRVRDCPQFSIASFFLAAVSSLAVVGIVGNVLVIIVVLKTPNMRTATNCYLVSLAATDTLFFVAAMPGELIYTYASVYPYGHVGCALLTFTSYLAINVSSLCIAAFSIERYIVICFPMKARYVCTVKRACTIIAMIWCFSICYNSFWLYFATVRSNYCTHRIDRNSTAYQAIYFFDLIAFYFGPMFLYLLLYGQIAVTLRRSHQLQLGEVRRSQRVSRLRAALNHALKLLRGVQRRSDSVVGSGSRSRNEGSMAGPGAPVANAQVPVPDTVKCPGRWKMSCKASKVMVRDCPQGASKRSVLLTASTEVAVEVQPDGESLTVMNLKTKKNEKSNKSRNQVVKMLAIIAFIFAVCWLPYRAVVLYNSFATNPFYSPNFIMFAKLMIFINCSINPVLYNLLSSKFRLAFKSMFCGRSSLSFDSRFHSRAYSRYGSALSHHMGESRTGGGSGKRGCSSTAVNVKKVSTNAALVRTTQQNKREPDLPVFDARRRGPPHNNAHKRFRPNAAGDWAEERSLTPMLQLRASQHRSSVGALTVDSNRSAGGGELHAASQYELRRLALAGEHAHNQSMDESSVITMSGCSARRQRATRSVALMLHDDRSLKPYVVRLGKRSTSSCRAEVAPIEAVDR